ncbi:epralysin [Pseudomonas asplenii]|uniref:Epralysin n=1 Tax=Pseudomonas asplenii TaxID=53407 RepID=A0A0M9GI99_9PSED|nr:serralysin family metalloprotease [Pseudomonas fuscovaginae]KPA91882.1 epralysin [Pseudomonas fuscovaginae]
MTTINSPITSGKPSYSVDQAAQQLTRSGQSWKDKDGNGTVELTFAFPDTPPSNFVELKVDHGLGGFGQFSALQQAQAVLALQSWADVANLSFTEAPSGGEGHLSFGNYEVGPAGSAAFAYAPGSDPDYDGQSWYLVSDSYDLNSAPGLNNYGRMSLVHEIGHTLGLSHPSDYGANVDQPSYRDAGYVQDTLGYSIMSYFSESNTGQNFVKNGAEHYSSAPLRDDIAAIQKLYGANYSTRADDTVYGFNSNTGRDYLSAQSSADALVFSVWDGGGNDTLDFSGFTQDQEINLRAGSFSDVGGLRGNVSIAHGVTLENAIGGSGHDVLIGNDVANELRGGAGSDILQGGGGADRLWGGEGNDIFVFGAITDSTPQASDRIMDFVSGQDQIDLGRLTQGGGLSFVDAFTGRAGEAVLSRDADTDQGTLAIDFSGQGLADFQVVTVGRMAVTDILV